VSWQKAKKEEEKLNHSSTKPSPLV
jgi:hypothetical protein